MIADNSLFTKDEKNKNKVVVKELSQDITFDIIYDQFSELGEIETIQFNEYNHNNKIMKIAIITFQNIEYACNTILKFKNNIQWKVESYSCHFVNKQDQLIKCDNSMFGKRLLISQLPKTVNYDGLMKQLSNFGSVSIFGSQNIFDKSNNLVVEFKDQSSIQQLTKTLKLQLSLTISHEQIINFSDLEEKLTEFEKQKSFQKL